MSLHEQLQIDKKHIWHPFTALKGVDAPLLVESGEGILLHTADGRTLLDLVASWWVNIHGHGNKELATVLYEQALKLEHTIFAGFTHNPAIDLTKAILSMTPPGHQRVFFTDNGSTAVEVGIKAALQYWVNLEKPHRKKLVAIDGAYHGDTFGAMSVGGRSAFSRAFEPLLFDVDFVPFPDKVSEFEALRKLEMYFESGEIAAFIYEPLVQGAGGMRMYSEEWLEKALQMAKQYGVLCIADEVFTGFGRTGKPLSSDHVATKPDIIALSKGITGGTMPLGLTSFHKDVVAAFESKDPMKTLFHGHSYTANPLACAVAVKSYEIFMRDSCQEAIEWISQAHLGFIEKIKPHAAIDNVRSRGTILAIELKTGEDTSYFNDIRKTIYDYFLSKNMLMRPLGNVFYLVPPYVISKEQLQKVYAEIENFLETLS